MSWFNNLVGSLVQQSESLLSEVQGGLSEFVSVVQEDTTKQALEVERNLANAHIVETVSKGISTLISGGPADGASTGESSVATSGGHVRGGAVFTDRKNADLEELRRDPATYLDSPADKETFLSFERAFKLSDKTEEISKLLSSHSTLRALHARLVPALVDHEAFWLRYYYRVSQLDQQGSRRKDLLAASSQEEEIGWGDDDDSSSTSTVAKATPVVVPAPAPVVSTPAPIVASAAASQASPVPVTIAAIAAAQVTSAPVSTASDVTDRSSESSYDMVTPPRDKTPQLSEIDDLLNLDDDDDDDDGLQTSSKGSSGAPSALLKAAAATAGGADDDDPSDWE